MGFYQKLVSLTILISTLLRSALLTVYYLLRERSSFDGEKITPFECGFTPLRETRNAFSTRFFLLVVIFLIFDVEVALLFPILRSLILRGRNLLIGVRFFMFLTILLFGTFHEWNEGALD